MSPPSSIPPHFLFKATSLLENGDQLEKTHLKKWQPEKSTKQVKLGHQTSPHLYPTSIKLPTGDGAPDNLRCVFSSGSENGNS